MMTHNYCTRTGSNTEKGSFKQVASMAVTAIENSERI